MLLSRSFYSLFILAVFLAFGCGADDDDTNGSTTGTFEVDIDGSRFSANLSSATFASIGVDSSASQPFLFSITGLNSNGQAGHTSVSIIYFLADLSSIQTQSYSYDGVCMNDTSSDPCGIIGTLSIPGSPILAHSSNGSADSRHVITFTTADIRDGGRVSGTFSGTLFSEDGTTSQVLTNGQFNLPVIEQ